MSHFKPSLMTLAFAAAGFGMSVSAHAADGDQAKKEKEVETIEVTLDRRSQSIQDYAGTAQVFSQDEMKKLGITPDFTNLQTIVPGLQISQNEGFAEIYIRGIGTQDNQPTTDSATAVHFNGIYIPRSRGIGPMMFDLQRVEINKGPQGTLRGRNATAGTINFIPNAPVLGEWEGKVSAGIGNYDSREYEAVINVPLADDLAMRISTFGREHGNFYSNALEDHTQGATGAGAEKQNAWRINVLYQPSDRFSAQFVYDHGDITGNGFPGNYFGQAYSDGYTPSNLDDPYRQNFLTEGYVDTDIDGYQLKLTYNFDAFSVEYTGGFRRHNAFNRNSRRPFQFGSDNPAINDVSDVLTADFDNFGTNNIWDRSESTVHEIRFFSPDDARLRWTAGYFTMDEEQYEFRFDTSDKSLGQSSLGGESRSRADIKAQSIFADATYDLTDDWRVKGGIRWTEDDKESLGYQVQYAFDFGADVTGNDVRFSTPGYMPTRPGNSQYLYNGPGSAHELFMANVGTFGARDTLDDFIAQHGPDSVSMTVTGVDNWQAGDNIALKREFKEDYVDYRIGVEHDLDEDHLIYAALTTGSRSGGLNGIVRLESGELAAPTFDREKLTSWEFGSKNEFDIGDSHVVLNATLFYYDYQDQVLQVGAVGDGGSFTPGETNVNANLVVLNVNVGESAILGLEVDGRAYLPYDLDLGWNFSYLDSEYKDAVVSDGRQNIPGGSAPNVNINGNPLMNVSKYNAMVHLGQAKDLDFGTWNWRVTASYRSSFHATPFAGRGFDANGNEIPLDDMPTCCFAEVSNGTFFNDKVDGFVIWNFSTGLTFGDDEQYRVEGYINNITEESYAQKQIINHYVNIAFLNNPRQAGLRFTANF